MFIDFLNMGLVSKEQLTMGNASMITNSVMAAVVRNASGFWKQVEQYAYSPVNIVARGKEGNKKTTYRYRLVGHAGPANAIHMSLCARMLYSGEINTKGVLAPEGATDAQALVNELVQRGAHFFEEKTVEQEIQF